MAHFWRPDDDWVNPEKSFKYTMFLQLYQLTEKNIYGNEWKDSLLQINRSSTHLKHKLDPERTGLIHAITTVLSLL